MPKGRNVLLKCYEKEKKKNNMKNMKNINNMKKIEFGEF
jgi:hypothetical protein